MAMKAVMMGEIERNDVGGCYTIIVLLELKPDLVYY